MTEATTTTPPPPPPPATPPLVRLPDDRVIAGVCAALGRYTDTDPVIWRVTLGVLTVFGGAGLALYAVGWLLIPEPGRPSIAERVLHRDPARRGRGGQVLLVVAAAVLVTIVVGASTNGHGLIPLLVIGGAVWYAYHRRQQRGPQPAAAVAPAAGTSQTATAQWSAPPVWTPPPPSPRSPLGRVTVSITAVVVAVLIGLRLSGVDSLTAPRIITVALGIVGVGLVVGAWTGRARGLIALGLLLLLALGPATVAERVGADGVGDRTWTPVAGAVQSDYRLGAGDATLDLTGLPAGTTGVITAKVYVGHLVVLVPSTVHLHLVSHVGAGELVVFGDHRSGTHLDDVTTSGSAPLGPEVRLSVAVGQLEVRRG